MNDISPLDSRNAAITGVQNRHAAADPFAAPPIRRQDSVEVSEAARLLAKLAELPDVRQDLVDRVKAEIEAGSYETTKKLETAIESLAEDL